MGSGYHIVWSVCIPILIVELLFLGRGRQPWLRWRGVTVCAIVYALAALALGMVFRKMIMPGFHTTSLHLIVTAGLACTLVMAVLAWPKTKLTANDVPNPASRLTPPWWLAGILAAIWAASLFGLFLIPASIKPTKVVAIFMLAQLAFTGVLVWRLQVVSRNNPGWTDAHRWALVFGAVLVSSGFGLLAITAGSRIDQIGVALFSGVTLITLFILATGRAKSRAPRVPQTTT